MNESIDRELSDLRAQIVRLEERLGAVERRVGSAAGPEATAVRATVAAEPPVTPVKASDGGGDDLEYEIGQVWFAKIGIFVLALGAGFALSQPFPTLPPWLPSAIGYAAVAGLFLLARFWSGSFALLAGYLRGAAMLLLFSSTLRLYYFGAETVMRTDTLAGKLLLVAVVAANFAIGWRRRSLWLTALALLMGHMMLLVSASTDLVLWGLPALAAVSAGIALRANWPALPLASIGLAGPTYVLWAANNPVLGRPWRLLVEPALAPVALLAVVAVLGVGAWWRAGRAAESWLDGARTLLLCVAGYGLALMHALVIGGPAVLGVQLVAAALLMGLAVGCWVREHSRLSTFLFAMAGYLALSVAIVRSSAVPDLFIWLSLESLLVIATAIWFRSRFIVVANFAIFVGILLAYIAAVRNESGVSILLGIVALASARIMNWQKDRLELKTELMRNCYLLSAFLVFPYALYHLVPARFVALAWVGAAMAYYGLNVFIRSPKYRWMGHGTLLLTALYVVVAGMGRMSGALRVVSFLVLGVVLVVVSLVFTRMRSRPRP